MKKTLTLCIILLSLGACSDKPNTGTTGTSTTESTTTETTFEKSTFGSATFN
jgi:hypothetical protein